MTYQVMVVEDELAHAELIRRAFAYRNNDYDVHVFYDLASARNYLEVSNPDLVFADYKLPDGTGSSLLEIARLKSLPVVVMTSHGNEEVAVEVMREGALDYIVKNEDTLFDMPHIAERALREWRYLREKEQAEATLRRSENSMMAMISAMPDTLLMLDRHGVIQDLWLGTAEPLTLLSKGMKGSSLESVFPLQPASEIMHGILRLQQTRQTQHMEIDVASATQNIRYEVRLAIADSEADTIFCILRDITELAKSREEKEQLQKSLQQAQKMEAIGQLTGGIAHDFNNILASILGYSELALMRYIPDRESKLFEYVQQIYQSGKRARDLVAQLLVFSRGQSIDSVPLDIIPLTKEGIKMIRPALPSSIALEFDHDPQLPKVLFDPTQFHQALMNLVINARDAMNEKGMVKVSMHRVSLAEIQCVSCHAPIEGDFVELCVEDTGAGIEKHLLNKIFDPFFTTKENGKGSGMGLSVLHGIVHEHGGHIVVESEPDCGTRFRLLLQFVETESTAPAIRVDDIRSVSGAGRKVLIVDDEVSVANLISEWLKARGFETVVCYNSPEALAYYENQQSSVDLVITDQAMPAMTGVELSQRILAMDPAQPICICTGYSEYINAEKARELGIQAYLEKPISITELAKVVESFFGVTAAVEEIH